MVNNHGGFGTSGSHHGKAGNQGRSQLSRIEDHGEGQLRKNGGQTDTTMGIKQEVIKIIQEKIEANQQKMDAIQEKIGVVIKSSKEKVKATVSAVREKMKSAMNSIWSELEKTIKKLVEDVLSCVDQETNYLCKELN
jgi:hypothetical protein